MNWGKGIAIALTLFIGFIIYLVIGLVSQTTDLESEDYYKREIAYEEEITSLNNANNPKYKADVDLTETHLVIRFQEDQVISNAVLHLKRPNDVNEDKTFVIQDTKTFTLSREELKAGIYKVELSYEVDGKPCLRKENIYI